MKPRTIITMSMLFVATMALTTTPGWVTGARDFVSSTTGHQTPKRERKPTPNTGGGLMPNTRWELFALGIGGLWVLLLGLADTGTGGEDLASALALTVAGSSAMLYAPQAFENLGLAGK